MFESYVGLPFKAKGMDRDGVSCWGLVRLAIGELRGVWLPRFDDAPDDLGSDDLERYVENSKSDWRPVLRLNAKQFDAIILYDRGAATHIGLVTRPGWFLHVGEGRTSAIERYDSPAYTRIIEGFYRHRRIA